MGAVQRHQAVSQRIGSGVERDRQRDRRALRGKAVDRRDDAARRHRDATGADPSVRGEDSHRFEGRVQIGKRLAHPHVHHVCDGAEIAVMQRSRSGAHLVDDLRGRATAP